MGTAPSNGGCPTVQNSEMSMCKWNVLSLSEATSLCGVVQDVKNKWERRQL